jgi:hypothetical protein
MTTTSSSSFPSFTVIVHGGWAVWGPSWRVEGCVWVGGGEYVGAGLLLPMHSVA